MLRRLIGQSNCHFNAGPCYGQKGKDHLWQNVPRYNIAARQVPFVILADLDREECPMALIERWLPGGRHGNLLVRIAVREVESWLLADRKSFADFLGVSEFKLPKDPDAYEDPKRLVVNLARDSRRRDIREDLVPLPGSTSRIGRNYIGRLGYFVDKYGLLRLRDNAHGAFIKL